MGNKFIKIVPGPGAYSPEEKKRTSYSFSFGLKPSVDYHSKYHSTIPGPGSYNSRAVRTFSTQGASLDKSEREKLLNKT
jgi:Sperm-tail PG-rich repeat